MNKAIDRKKNRKIVCLCGSVRFKEAFMEANHEETLKGNIVLTVGDFRQHDGVIMTDEVKASLDRLHFDKIELADEILVLNVDGYIGWSTSNEIEHAKKLGKRIRYLEKS